MKLKIQLIFLFFGFETILFSAEAGMPQLDSKYWLSQSFWLILIFSLLYLSISKFFIPKIKDNLDNREKKIKDNLNEAKSLSELAEEKYQKYEKEMLNAKKEVVKIASESKKQLEKNLSQKKQKFEKTIEDDIKKVENEIINFKKNSFSKIKSIAEDISSKLIEDIIQEKFNNNSVKASIEEVTKNKEGKI